MTAPRWSVGMRVASAGPEPGPKVDPRQQLDREPEPEREPLGMVSLFAGFPSNLVADAAVGGMRGVVASRDIAAGERVLASAPLGVSVDWRHRLTGCAHCFATRETADGPGDADGEWELHCPSCCSCYYCSEACMAAAAPQHGLECGALCAVEGCKKLTNVERAMARLAIGGGVI